MMYELKLEQADAILILRALGELPIKVAINTFGKVQHQVAEQDAASALELNVPAE